MKRIFSAILTIAMILSTFTVMASGERVGVTGLKNSGTRAAATMSWTNPTDEDFVKNVVYYAHNGGEPVVWEETTGTTTTTTKNFEVAGNHKVTVVSHFADGSTAEAAYRYFMEHSVSFNGWTLWIWDRNDTVVADGFRGEWKIDDTEASAGDKSAYFRLDDNAYNNYYMQLNRNISIPAGVKHKIRFKFKTNNAENGRIVYGVNNVSGGKITITSDTYPEGQWYEASMDYVYETGDWNTGLASRKLQIQFDRKGEYWIDDVEVIQVDDEGNRIGASDALERYGTFEDEKGVTGLTLAGANPDWKLSWTNPTDGTVVKNEIYKQLLGGEKTLLATLTGGETSYNDAGAYVAGNYIYYIKTFYESGNVVEDSKSIYRRATDKTSIPKWSLDSNDQKQGIVKFRGGGEVSFDEAYDGESSAHLWIDHKREGSTYHQLFAYWSLTSGTEYTYSFRFKTKDHAKYGDSFFSFYDPSTGGNVRLNIANKDYVDDEWTLVERKFTAAGNLKMWFEFDAYGHLYIDDIQVYKTSDETKTNLLSEAMGSFETAEAVSGLASKATGLTSLDISWTNPSSVLDKNEVYLVNGEERTLLATYTNGETSYSFTDGEAGGAYDFAVVSYFGNITKEATVTGYTSRYTNTSELVPGWSIDYRDPNVARFRGKFGYNTNPEYIKTGNSSLFFNFEEVFQSNYYYRIIKTVNVTAGKTYCFSGWIKTDGYGEGRTRFSVGLVNKESTYNVDFTNKVVANPVTGENDAFDNGQWYQFKHYYTPTSNHQAWYNILLESKGTMYIDDVELWEVTADENGGYTNVSEIDISGDFDGELLLAPNVNVDDATAVADVYVGNCYLMKDTAKLYLATYDSADRLISVTEKSWTECKPAEKEYTAYEGFMQLTIPYTDGQTVKAFVWDGLKPLCNATVY